MSDSVTDTLLEPLSQFVAERMGLNFPPERWPDLARGMRTAAREFGFHDADDCVRWLLSSPLTDRRLEVLARHLTVGETYFLRDKPVFTFFSDQILPELISSRPPGERRLRIWSAGCATGEEPYSIAILLRQAIPDFEDWNVTLLATDINPGALEKAAQGIYSQWSFRNLPAEFRRQHFTTSADGHHRILPKFLRMVTVGVLNLAEDTFPALWSNTNAMDVIFCRNVLMYFAPAQAQRAVRNLHRCLVEGGWLIVSGSEASHTLFAGFRAVNTPGATIYRKDGTATSFPQVSPLGMQETFPPPTQSFAEPSLAEERLTQSEHWPWEAAHNGTAPVPAVAAGATKTAEGNSGEPAGLAASQEGTDAAALANLARVHANQGRLPEALAWCEKAVAADKLNAACHYLHAVILLESGATAESMKRLRQAIYLDPQFVLAHVALGMHARREGRIRESARHFENVLALLRARRPEELVPEAEGITAGRMEEIVRATLRSEGAR